MTNEEYITLHRKEDVRRLALQRIPDGIDHKWCLQQIEGWQMACRKLPTWAATEGLWYPVRLSMEQCSGEQTAQYKRQLAERLIAQKERRHMADLTGGLGVDFSYMATLFDEATYVEMLPELRRLAAHNMPLLGIGEGKLRIEDDGFTDSERFQREAFQLIYLDPARRDGVGRKTVGIADCTPNVLEMQDKLLGAASWVMLKLSPMLDITEALRQLRHVREVHVLSTRGECKELLFLLSATPQENDTVTVYCVNLGTDEDVVKVELNSTAKGGTMATRLGTSVGHAVDSPSEGNIANDVEGMLFEPNASVLKAGVQDTLGERYGVRKLHPMSNLFVGKAAIPNFPGRQLRIVGTSDFSKRGLKGLIGDLARANLTTRNFPVAVERLRKQLRLAEGGDTYLFATTVSDGSHVLIRCER